MTPEVSALVFGLFAALSWGAGDFNGGLATKRASVIGVVITSQMVGIILLIVLGFATREPVPIADDLFWGAFAGIVGLVGLAALYRGLAIGQAGVIAPVSSAVSAIIPLTYSILTRGWPQSTQMMGFALAVISIVLVSYSGGRLGKLKGIQLAFVAGLGFAGFFILLDRVASDSVFWVLVASRSASLLTMALFVVISRQNWRRFIPAANVRWIVLLAGLLDVGGNVFFVLATQSNRLDIASVVTSLYPAMTVVLAWWVLGERLTRLQFLGVSTALLAIALISL